MFTQNFDFRGAVILTCEGKIIALIRRYLENRPASEICDQLQRSDADLTFGTCVQPISNVTI